MNAHAEMDGKLIELEHDVIRNVIVPASMVFGANNYTFLNDLKTDQSQNTI